MNYELLFRAFMNIFLNFQKYFQTVYHPSSLMNAMHRGTCFPMAVLTFLIDFIL
jgi:hypothetical protein